MNIGGPAEACRASAPMTAGPRSVQPQAKSNTKKKVTMNCRLFSLPRLLDQDRIAAIAGPREPTRRGVLAHKQFHRG